MNVFLWTFKFSKIQGLFPCNQQIKYCHLLNSISQCIFPGIAEGTHKPHQQFKSGKRRKGYAPFTEEKILLYNVVAICMKHVAKDTSVEWGLKSSTFYFSHAWLITTQGRVPAISVFQKYIMLSSSFLQNLTLFFQMEKPSRSSYD